MRAGEYQARKFPYVLGRDFSGVVSAVGDGVHDLGAATRCSACCEAGREGAYAEKIAISAAIVAQEARRACRTSTRPRWR